MKKDIHPKYYKNAKVSCACGNTFETGSTIEHIKTELCFVCHPFYTGKQKLVDSARRVEKFEAKLGAKKDTVRGKRAKRATRDKARIKKEITVKAEKEKVSTTSKSSGRTASTKKKKADKK
ncbi:50S ribosomal protein L31 [Candidatus Falkowbacteria bacterium RIFOXYB2_FULL_34_18]|uniref:Large ribosomal subunit protein bL31 n=1 Tax=Candidatus Falkowbacteria bacterium RIFOXYD2_FULL_34_120 TaxID=1798007 RepID=A0A1F5TN90_9BACT|nr:MAG: 50S ribosomal protein L31 [Candidatus Falkowbacteria bacterium RIFOXYC12_FULL_34_55]OGF28838.1 MAG: 50S ribosomal protein L31 [Candidatus Falkowbacteria bacterium RIFOXYB2_FULL_34_18]OGF38390.1 MAG: 50S ribosomal protein L31 [Candidatus Falkowbacteria bacterium RIFOXYD12_FULL_34_57]OGF40380.1 MAG: 50S ribosomal protein L31 [Candidatus Falkowbacteria bacterium RIFOXYD2_FULL_34_120]